MTLTAKRAVLASLARLLITHEVVDRQALDQLLVTPVSEAASPVPVQV